jgi:sugar lactone lactonase YvrE
MRRLAFLLLALLALPAQAVAGGSCADSGGVGYVCGVNNPEDLLRVEGTPFVLTSNMGTQDERGGFFSVDVRTRAVRDVEPDFSSPARAEYPGCPGPPDAERFTSHGLDIEVERGVRTVYAVNHGGRESIEVFRLDADAAGLRLTWIGCAVIPEGHAANSVAALPDGGFVTTVPIRGDEELLNAAGGRPTGQVLRWSAGGGWRPVPGVELSFPNGILVSPDGSTLYVAAYTEQAVAKLPLSGGAAKKVEVPFNPDNLRWAPGGEILATGQNEQPAVVQLTCVQSSNEVCQVPTGVSKVDPASLRATTLYERPGDERFGAGTSSIVVGGELWIGSFRAQRLLRVPRRALEAPVSSERDEAGAPELRLTRRCTAGGRLRVALRGDVDRVRDVSFKFAKRLVVRDADAPHTRTIGARTLRSTRARSLRAVAYLREGEPLRLILSRTLPRCARRPGQGRTARGS